jgi:hypothetical protein
VKILGQISDYGACSWFRMVMPLLALAGRHEIRMVAHGSKCPGFDPDVIVYQRVSQPEILADMKAYQAAGKRVVHDSDDDFRYLPPSNPCASMYSTGKPATKIFEEAVRIADGMTCSTPGIAAEYADLRDEFIVIPNTVWPVHLDEFERPITGKPKSEGEIRIGYAGTNTHDADVALIAKPLKKLMERYPQVKVVSILQRMFVGTEFLRRCEYHPGIEANKREQPVSYMLKYYKLLDSMDFDIALAPLQSSTFNRCKSPIKLFEYGLCNIPVAASRFGPYAPYPKVVHCSDDRQWLAHLSMLVESADLRANLARDSREYIRANCTIANTLPLWENALTG